MGKHQKRISVPNSWQISKKSNKWITATRPGPHNKQQSIPLGVVLRDMLGIVDTRAEAKRVLSEGNVFVDATFLIAGGIVFALFWIETTGMGAKPTAKKIFNSGMQIPGFRRNIGSIEKVMIRYIPKVTVIGGAFIGFLTLVASLLGTLGGAGGTGLLLTVSIVYRLYEDIASEQMMEMHPMVRSFFGQE